MRYIGNKQNLLPQIESILKDRAIFGNSFFDVFSGTASVGKYFKNKGYKVYSSDLMYYSYVLQRAYIENNEVCRFEKLLPKLKHQSLSLFSSPLDIVLDYLGQVKPLEGFIYKNYTPEGSSNLEKPRMFFTSENGQIIDAIRCQIEVWKEEDYISENEYYFLLACLIETVPFYANITGVYAAFHKKWDTRAIKRLTLRAIDTVSNKHKNKCYNQNSTELLNELEADIFYLDPPYNQRQYAPNYHLLETIARYDNPQIKGVGGLRDYSNQKSKFCNAQTAIQELDKIAKYGKYKYLVLSYNNEGIMQKDNILATLRRYGKVELVEFDHLRFKSNNNVLKPKKYIQEQLYILRR